MRARLFNAQSLEIGPDESSQVDKNGVKQYKELPVRPGSDEVYRPHASRNHLDDKIRPSRASLAPQLSAAFVHSRANP